MNLRPYQVECRTAIAEAYKAGKRRVLCVLATGLGKAVTAAHTASKRQRTMFLVHRDELAQQAAAKFAACNVGLRVGVEMADSYAGDADIVVGSVQTLSRKYHGGYGPRLMGFRPEDFAIVQVDECHRATSNSFTFVLDYFRVMKNSEREDKSKLLIGWTATPNRSDQIGLEKIFSDIVYNYGIREGVNNGWLTRIEAHWVQTSVDLSHVRVTHGDFAVDELSSTVNTPERNELIARKYDEICPGKPALFFTVDIQHSHDLAATMQRHGWAIFPLSGKTDKNERRNLIRALSAGEIHGLASCAIFDEGTDIPSVAVAVLAAPTKSGLRYRQRVGRVLRPYPSPEDLAAGVVVPPERVKDKAIVIDVCDVTAMHQLVTMPTIFGLRGNFNAKGKDILAQAEEIEQMRLKYPTLDLDLESMEAIKSAVQQVDLLAPPSVPPEIKIISRLGWLKTAGMYHINLPDHSMLSVRENALGQWEVSRHLRGVRTTVDIANHREGGIQRAERLISKSDLIVLRATAQWKTEPPTQAQATRVWMLDSGVRRQYHSDRLYFDYVYGQFRKGSTAFDRGAMSARISSLLGQRGCVSKSGS